MRFEIDQRYEAECDAVLATYLDTAFYAQLAPLPSVGRIDVLSQEERDGQVRRRIRYAFQAHLSAAVRAVLDPAKLTWVDDSTVDRRDGRTEFTFLPDVYADRLTCTGTKTLTPAQGGGCVQHTVADIRVKAAFVAGPVERAIVSGLRQNATAEAEAVVRWIAANGQAGS